MCCLALASCTGLTATEYAQLQDLQKKGITVDHPKTDWEKPANAGVAGALNILPGMGNFYLGFGDGAERMQILYGIGNFLTWPYSIIWGVPSAFSSARRINEIDLVHYYDEREQRLQRQFYNNPQPVRQDSGGEVYYPGNGYYYNGFYEQNDVGGRNTYSEGSCDGNCGGYYYNSRNHNNGGYYDSYGQGSNSRNTYNGMYYNNSSSNAMPYNGNAYTEEYFDRQEEDSHKYDWERYYYR